MALRILLKLSRGKVSNSIRNCQQSPVTFSCQRGCSSLGNLYQDVLNDFPKNRCLVLAYGSGVFQQDNNIDMRNNMTDFIIGVNNSVQWHDDNLRKHPRHYSSLARLGGARRVARCQEEYGARFYFNTLVPWRDKGLIKYGVINRKHLENDLLNWTTLYLAGRLHKPVKILECDPDLKSTLDRNLMSAITVSLLMLPDSFTEEDLFLTVAGISYMGDFRMTVGEDRNKVSNIVRPQLHRFKKLYSGVLDQFSENLQFDNRGCYHQDTSPAVRRKYLLSLPSSIHSITAGSCGNIDADKNILNMNQQDSRSMLETHISQIVAKTDKSQALKGILTAGGRKTIVYSLAKLRKMFKSMNKK